MTGKQRSFSDSVYKFIDAANSSIAKGHLSEARESLIGALVVVPDCHPLYLILGTVVLGQGNLPEAGRFFTRAAGLVPKDTQLQLMANVFRNSNDQANNPEGLLFRALEVYPDNLFIIKLLATVLRDKGQFRRALVLYANVMENNESEIEWYLAAAQTYRRAGDMANARAVYEKALKLDPNSQSAAENLTVLHFAKSFEQGKQPEIDISALPDCISPDPAGKLDLEQLANIAAAFAKYSFYHVISLTEHVSTPGKSDYFFIQQQVLDAMRSIDLKGKRVLDIGCRDGLFSFEAERLQSAKVIGIDNDLSKPAVDFLIPYLKSQVQMHHMNLLDLTPDSFGLFDVVILAGVLYHLRYPFHALRLVKKVLAPGGTMILETAIWDSQDKLPMLYCPVGEESPYENSSVTFFNEKGIHDTLRSLGMVVESAELLPLSAPGAVPTEHGCITRGCFVCRISDEVQNGSLMLNKECVTNYWDDLHQVHTELG